MNLFSSNQLTNPLENDTEITCTLVWAFREAFIINPRGPDESQGRAFAQNSIFCFCFFLCSIPVNGCLPVTCTRCSLLPHQKNRVSVVMKHDMKSLERRLSELKHGRWDGETPLPWFPTRILLAFSQNQILNYVFHLFDNMWKWLTACSHQFRSWWLLESSDSWLK